MSTDHQICLDIDARVTISEGKPYLVTVERTPGYEALTAYGDGFISTHCSYVTGRGLHDLECPIVDITPAKDKDAVKVAIVGAQINRHFHLDDLLSELAEMDCILSFPGKIIFHISTLQAKR
jgi:hypothetical protein